VFHDMPQAIADRMAHLEEIDARDRVDGTARLQRLRSVLPQTGRLIALLAASAPDGRYVEIGTSAGYSTLWIALACRMLDRRVTTYEVMNEKAALARETFALCGVEGVVDFVHADARDHLGGLDDVAFCFLDAEKDVYDDCYEAVIPRMKSGGLFVADNAVNLAPQLQTMLGRALADDRVDAMVVAVDDGVLVCRKR